MGEEEKIKFTEKKVDESWKQSIQSEKDHISDSPGSASHPVSFLEFISSLGVQTLIHLGDVENPVTRKKVQDLEAARQTIDLLLVLKEKTKGNLTPEEDSVLTALIPDLQLRYVEKST